MLPVKFVSSKITNILAISGLDWCDFVVCTNVGINIERIGFNLAYWQGTFFSKLTEFYLNYADRSKCNEQTQVQTQAPKAV